MPNKLRPKTHVYDSATGQEFPKHRRYAIAYEPFWQSIRHQLRWKEYEVARQSLAKCDGYVELAKLAATTRPQAVNQRVWRVFNLLCAIPHGQSTKIGVRIVERSATAILIPALDRYRELLKDVGYPTVWDWNWTRMNAQLMQRAVPDTLVEIHEALSKNRGSKYRSWHGKPEFWYYMDIMEEVMDDDDHAQA